jgi:hypothetical protein
MQCDVTQHRLLTIGTVADASAHNDRYLNLQHGKCGGVVVAGQPTVSITHVQSMVHRAAQLVLTSNRNN